MALPMADASFSIVQHTPLLSRREAGTCESSLPALNPWGCLPGSTRPLGSFAFMPLRLCRAQLSVEDRRTAFPEARPHCGGEHIGSRSLCSGKGGGESSSCAWGQITGEYGTHSSQGNREAHQAVPVQAGKAKMGKGTQSL